MLALHGLLVVQDIRHCLLSTRRQTPGHDIITKFLFLPDMTDAIGALIELDGQEPGACLIDIKSR